MYLMVFWTLSLEYPCDAESRLGASFFNPDTGVVHCAQLGAPPSRTTSNLGSPGSTPGTPVIATGGSPSPLGAGAVAASPMGVPPATPEQVLTGS